ncbi:MAG: T9SS type A sorting domain-containing protein [Bacteroidota bacterium]
MKQFKPLRFMIVFVFFLGLTMSANAQKWASVGTKWVYTQAEPFSTATWPSEWNAVDTITIKGKLCTIIQSKGNPFDTNSKYNRTMITYEDSDIVYWYLPVLKGFTVLYDFNKKVGESWNIEGLEAAIDTTKCSIKMTVTKVGVDTINGIPLKTMLAESYPVAYSFGGKIIQYIGNLSNIRPNPCFVCKPISENFDIYGLRCFESDSVGFHDFKIVPDCYYATTKINELKNDDIVSFTPNPFADVLSIKSMRQVTVSVFNLVGQTVFRKTIQDGSPIQINTANWLSGIYWYRIDFQNQDISYGKLIKH